jgi:hypothetical protein
MPYYNDLWEQRLHSLEGSPGFGMLPYTSDEEDIKQKRREEALAILCALTGKNFGYDTAAWRDYLNNDPDSPKQREARGEEGEEDAD